MSIQTCKPGNRVIVVFTQTTETQTYIQLENAYLKKKQQKTDKTCKDIGDRTQGQTTQQTKS